MHKAYVVQIDDRCGEDGREYPLCVFTTRAEALLLKQKIEQVFYYIEQRVQKLNKKIPTLYTIMAQHRLLKCIKKNPKFYYLKGVYSSFNFESGPNIKVFDLDLYESYTDIKRS